MNMLEFATVALCDERPRPEGRDRPVSITFTSYDGDTQWGEFLTWEEAARAYFWLGQLLGGAS